MAVDPLFSALRPNFPVVEESESGTSVTLKYVERTEVLEPLKPDLETLWGDWIGRVVLSRLEPLGRSGYSELTVETRDEYSVPEDTTPEVVETYYELEWVPVNRSLFEHPGFRCVNNDPEDPESGPFALDDYMRMEVEAWKKEKDTVARSLFQYYRRDKFGNPIGAVETMDPNAAYFCEYLLLGIDSYDDYAPVARRTKTYSGSPPTESNAGQKVTLTGFPNLPTGYEWRQSADRQLRTAGQRRWSRADEFQGADKVLLDKDELFL